MKFEINISPGAFGLGASTDGGWDKQQTQHPKSKLELQWSKAGDAEGAADRLCPMDWGLSECWVIS